MYHYNVGVAWWSRRCHSCVDEGVSLVDEGIDVRQYVGHADAELSLVGRGCSMCIMHTVVLFYRAGRHSSRGVNVLLTSRVSS